MQTNREFEALIRSYLAREIGWDRVHEFVIKQAAIGLPLWPLEYEEPLEELAMIFMADSRDDPQFRAADREIQRILGEFSRLKADVAQMGAAAVIEREAKRRATVENQRRAKYLDKHLKKTRRLR